MKNNQKELGKEKNKLMIRRIGVDKHYVLGVESDNDFFEIINQDLTKLKFGIPLDMPIDEIID